MKIKEIVSDIIRDYIRKMAYKKNQPEEKIRVVLYLKSQHEVGVYILEEYTVAEDVITLKNMLGAWAMSFNIVNKFISKSLNQYADEYECDIQAINCMAWLSEGGINLCLYNGHTAIKNIRLDDLLK